MKIAVMQPYLFPYIGYFQMINAVDVFVFYDDVNFIKQGWINRNRILLNGKDFMFTVPLEKANSFSTIKDTLINEKFYESWKKKFELTVEQNYKKAPHFLKVNQLLKDVLDQKHASISKLAINSISTISNYLGIQTKFVTASESYTNKDLERQERLVAICKTENANHYINAVGGQELYTKQSFLENDIQLSFIKTLPITYKQFNEDFIPWLSIIDVLMFNSVEEVNEMLDKYELV